MDLNRVSSHLIDFNYPEDVLIHVVHRAKETNGWLIAKYKVINDSPFIGAASYEMLFSGFLPYALKDTLQKPEEGYHLVSNLTAVFGLWRTDLDIQYSYGSINPITEEEYYDR